MGVAAPFIILVVLFFLVAPILGVVAFVRLARLEGRRRSGRNESVVGRVSALERQVSELSRRLQEVLKTTEPEGAPLLRGRYPASTLSGRRGRTAALTPVRRSNRTYSFPVSGFHKGWIIHRGLMEGIRKTKRTRPISS